MKLRPLQIGGKIGILAPAFPPNSEQLRKGIDYLLGLGYELELGDSLTARHGYFAGSDALRLNDLHHMFDDKSVDAIFCARGGWGALRLLDKIDYDLIAQNPKILVGYSDVTTLQLAIWQQTRIPSYSGPMVAVEMGRGILPFTSDNFWGQIQNEKTEFVFQLTENEIAIWQPGQAEGVLLGGCLSMIAHQLGTPYSPDYNNTILFLEDVGEPPYKIDRYLAQLKQAGILKRIKGVILGDFVDCLDENTNRSNIQLIDILKEYFADANYPVLYNFPYGHGMKKISMPIGVQVKLNTESAQLTLANPFK